VIQSSDWKNSFRDIDIIHNTIWGNSLGANCDGIALIENNNDIVIENNIIAGNSGWGINHSDNESTNISEDYNDIHYDNDGGVRYQISAGSHSFSSDPLFLSEVDPVNLYIERDSPCIGVGKAQTSPFDYGLKSDFDPPNTINLKLMGDPSDVGAYKFIQHGVNQGISMR